MTVSPIMLNPVNGAYRMPKQQQRRACGSRQLQSGSRNPDSSTAGPTLAPQRQERTGQTRAHGVLVVDDVAEVRELIRLQLHDQSHLHVVGEARDGREAIDAATRLQPDLVILDINMPGLGGLDALPLLRQAAPHAKILVLTAYSWTQVMEQALELGASGFIVKGTPRRGVVDAINATLK